MAARNVLSRWVCVWSVVLMCVHAQGMTIREDANLYQNITVEGTVEGEKESLPVEVIVGDLTSATVSFSSSVVGRSAYLGDNKITTPAGGTITKNTTYYCGVYAESTKLGRTASLEVQFHIRVLYAYTVVFDAQGGAGAPSSQTVRAGEKLAAITPPHRDGYDFLGFFTGNNGTGTMYFNSAGIGVAKWAEKSGATLYAAWKFAGSPVSLEVGSATPEVRSGNVLALVCTIAYDNGTSQTSSILPSWSVVSGADVVSVSASGVLTAGEVTESRTVQVKATYKGVESLPYVVTILPRAGFPVRYFPGNYGRGAAVADVKLEGRDLTLRGAVFRRRGYRQIRWSTSEYGVGDRYPLCGLYTPDKAVDLYPVWSRESAYAITFAPGRDGSGETVTLTKPTGADMVLPGAIFVRKGYRQIGWAHREGGTKAYDIGARYDQDDDDSWAVHQTFYPVWEKLESCSVVFYKGGAFSSPTELLNLSVYSGESFELPGKLVDDQIGWSKDSVVILLNDWTSLWFVNEIVRVAADTKFYAVTNSDKAKWKHTVRCVPDEYSCGPTNSYSTEQGRCITLPGALYSREGYSQTGWRNRQPGSSDRPFWSLGEQYDSNSNATLYPEWTKDYEIVCLPGASATGEAYHQVQSVGGKLTLPGALYSRPYCTQIGWSTRDGGECVYGLDETCSFSGDAKLYPYWDGDGKPPPAEYTIVGGVLKAYDGDGGNVVVPEGVTTILGDNDVFEDCEEIMSMTLPTSLVDVNVAAFSGCINMTNVIFRSPIQALGRSAFSCCFSLRSVELPNGVPVIGAQTFEYCTNLQYVVIGYGVSTIVGNAFEGCSSLCAVYAPLGQHAMIRNALRDAGLAVEAIAFYDYDVPGNGDGKRWSVMFAAGGGVGAMPCLRFCPDCVVSLPQCTFVPPLGRRFAGWQCSNGKRYDDGVLVFNLAEPGETVTMTAIWE